SRRVCPLGQAPGSILTIFDPEIDGLVRMLSSGERTIHLECSESVRIGDPTSQSSDMEARSRRAELSPFLARPSVQLNGKIPWESSLWPREQKGPSTDVQSDNQSVLAYPCPLC